MVGVFLSIWSERAGADSQSYAIVSINWRKWAFFLEHFGEFQTSLSQTNITGATLNIKLEEKKFLLPQCYIFIILQRMLDCVQTPVLSFVFIFHSGRGLYRLELEPAKNTNVMNKYPQNEIRQCCVFWDQQNACWFRFHRQQCSQCVVFLIVWREKQEVVNWFRIEFLIFSFVLYIWILFFQ